MGKEKHKWSGEVTAHSNALDLESDVFKSTDPKKIAASLKRSARAALEERPTLSARRCRCSPSTSTGPAKISNRRRGGRSKPPRMNCATNSNGVHRSIHIAIDMIAGARSGRRLPAFRIEQDIEVDATEILRLRGDGSAIQIQVLRIPDVEGDGPRGEPGTITFFGEGVTRQGIRRKRQILRVRSEVHANDAAITPAKICTPTKICTPAKIWMRPSANLRITCSLSFNRPARQERGLKAAPPDNERP